MPAVTSPPGYLPADVLLTTTFTGALLIGALFAFMANGVLIQMTYEYYERFKHDRSIFKWTVAFLFLVNLIHTAFVFDYEYENLITGFGDIMTLTDLKWSLTADFTLSAIVALVVQVFYAYRIYVLFNNRWLLPVVIVVLSIAGLGFSIAATIEGAKIYKTFPTPWLINDVAWVFDVAFALPAFADLLIVGAMFAGFWRTRKLDLPHQSFKAIRRVLFLAMETNLITTILCIVAAACISTNHRPVGYAVIFCLPKAYNLTLLLSLLARQSSSSGIRGDYQFDASDSSTASNIRRIGGADQTQSTLFNSPARAVKIACTTETVIEKDGMLEHVEARHGRPAIVPLVFSSTTPSSPSLDEKPSIDDINTLSYV